MDTHTNSGILPTAKQTAQAFRDLEALPDSAAISTRMLCALLGCIKTTAIRRAKRDKSFPQPRRVGNTFRWNVGEIRSLLAGDSR